ncbi:MAG: hypothetical protein ACFFAN_18930 [Promethearchaeota archaeon]
MIKMKLEKLADWPSPKATKRLIYLGFVVLWINYPIIIYLGIISNYPATFLESQLSFSGAVMKSHFKRMSAENLHYYRLCQVSDDVYDFCQIVMFFGLSLFLARKFDEDSGWRKSGFLIAILGVIGAICDIIENSLIIMMTTDPQCFPDIWAIAHSWFAVIKFTLWGIQAHWIIWADVKLLKKEIFSKKVFLAVIGIVLSQHWLVPLTAIGLLLG